MCKFIFKVLLSIFIAGQLAVAQPVDSSVKKIQPVHDAKGNNDQWFSRDKGLHFAGSLITTVLVSQSLQKTDVSGKTSSSVAAVSFSFSLGLGKEIIDGTKRGNHFSWKDLTADVAGIAVGFLLIKVK